MLAVPARCFSAAGCRRPPSPQETSPGSRGRRDAGRFALVGVVRIRQDGMRHSAQTPTTAGIVPGWARPVSLSCRLQITFHIEIASEFRTESGFRTSKLDSANADRRPLGDETLGRVFVMRRLDTSIAASGPPGPASSRLDLARRGSVRGPAEIRCEGTASMERPERLGAPVVLLDEAHRSFRACPTICRRSSNSGRRCGSCRSVFFRRSGTVPVRPARGRR